MFSNNNLTSCRWRWRYVLAVYHGVYLKRAHVLVDGAIHTAAGPKLLEECMRNIVDAWYREVSLSACSLRSIIEWMPNWTIQDHKRIRLASVCSRLSSLFMILWYWSVLVRRHIIHTVGPVYDSTNKEERAEKAEQLASAYRTSLALALENSIRHVVSYLLFLLLVFSRHSVRHSHRSPPASTIILSVMRHGSRWMRSEAS